MTLRPIAALIVCVFLLAPSLSAAPADPPAPVAPREAIAAWLATIGPSHPTAPSVQLALDALDALGDRAPDPARAIGAIYARSGEAPLDHLVAASSAIGPSMGKATLPPIRFYADVSSAVVALHAAHLAPIDAETVEDLARLDAALDPSLREALARIVAAQIHQIEVARIAVRPGALDLDLLAASRIAVAREVLAAREGIVAAPAPQCPDVACEDLVVERCRRYLVDARPLSQTHACRYDLSIDLYGDDRYVNNGGGASIDTTQDHVWRPLGAFLENEFHCVNTGVCHPTPFSTQCYESDRCESPASLFVDARGNDTYDPVFAASRDLPLPPHRPNNPPNLPFTDTNGDLVALNGAGHEGIGALFDLEGDDVYAPRVTFTRASAALNGGAMTGSGTLVDLGGDDRYESFGNRAFSNGAANGGTALLLDTCGDDEYVATFTTGAANGATSGGASALLDLCGNDTYDVSGDRGQANGAGSLGIGLLVDIAGDDHYDASIETGVANGAGQNGVGVLLDLDGADSYSASIGTGVANGGASTGIGLLVDAAGDNTFAVEVGRGGGNGAAYGTTLTVPTVSDAWTSLQQHCLMSGLDVDSSADVCLPRLPSFLGRALGAPLAGGVGVLVAGAGDDTYVSNGVSQGAASLFGLGALLDAGGSNRYDASAAAAPSTAGGCVASYDPSSGAVALGGPTLPSGRNGASVAWDGDDAWLMGGTDAGDLADIYRYHPSNDTAIRVGTLPQARYGAAAVEKDGSIYVLAGRAPSAPGEIFGSVNKITPPKVVRIVETTGVAYEMSNEMLVGRYRAASAWTGSVVYLFGGITSNSSFLDETMVYAPAPDVPDNDPYVILAKLPSKLAAASAVWTGTSALIFGGQTSYATPGAFRDTIFRFDPATGTYATLATTLPTPRSETAAVFDGARYAYVIGGRDADGPLDEIVRFDTWTDAIEIVARLPTQREEASAVWDGERVLIFGGGEECLRGFAQGAGHAGSVGILADFGDDANFTLRDRTRGQGSGAQGAGLLLHQPPDPFAATSIYQADPNATPFKVSGAGLSMRIDSALSQISGPSVLQGCTSDTIFFLHPPPIVNFFGSYPGAPDDRIYLCGVDETTAEPLLNPMDARAIGAIEKPPCAEIAGCTATMDTAGVGGTQRAWLEADDADATVSGGIRLIDIRIPNGTGVLHARHMVKIAPSADDACHLANCHST